MMAAPLGDAPTRRRAWRLQMPSAFILKWLYFLTTRTSVVDAFPKPPEAFDGIAVMR